MFYFLLLVSFIIGLWFFKLAWYVFLPLTIFLIIICFYHFKQKGVLISILFSFIGLSFASFNKLDSFSNDIYQGFVITSKENYFLIKSKGQKFYIYQKEHDFERGDYLKIHGSHYPLQMTTYESRFNFLDYLNDQGVRYEIKPKSISHLFKNPIRLEKLRQKFLNHFEKDTKSLVDAFLFSNKDYSDELFLKASSLNLIYLFSLSSLYLRSLTRGSEYLLNLKLTKRKSELWTFIIFLPLFIISFTKVSVRKIFFLTIIRYINNYYLKNKKPYIFVLTVLAFSFLIFDFNLAYQLSFLLSFGLSYFFFFLQTFFKRIHMKKRKYFYPLMLYLFLIPLHLSLSGEFHLLQLPFQLIAFPLHLIYVLFSTISLYFLPMVRTLNFLTRVLHQTYFFFAKYDITLITGSPKVLFFVLYYGTLLAVIYLKEVNLKRYLPHFSFALPFIILFNTIPYSNYYLEAVYLLNVGQGDAILIKDHQYHILVDTGGVLHFDMASEVLIPFFKKQKIKQIDLLITTHNDFDHNGAAPSLTSNFKVNTYLTAKEDFPVALGKLKLINLNYLNYDNDNDNSLVIYFTLMNKSWLLMGDASKEVEEDILNVYPSLKIDYLKVGHHGSNTSTSENFIKKTLPKEAIISCASVNNYGHPHEDVLEVLKKYDVKIRRTDLEGTICYSHLAF